MPRPIRPNRAVTPPKSPEKRQRARKGTYKRLREWYEEIAFSQEYQDAARLRLLEGKAPSLEAKIHETLEPARNQSVTGEIVIRWELPTAPRAEIEDVTPKAIAAST